MELTTLQASSKPTLGSEAAEGPDPVDPVDGVGPAASVDPIAVVASEPIAKPEATADQDKDLEEISIGSRPSQEPGSHALD